ncbi:MBL fold metallo-hydrolase [Acidobacteria bacterium AH-259-D05]|nr:MBL fold metallo-hydrolase [Acidobacteria bacterium AH-259-D05]
MKWGLFELHLISDGSVWLDGGAMFGVVPKVLWEKKTSPDEKNRIRLGLNCLLIQTDQKNLLIDTGCGFKYTEKERQIYRIEHETNVLRGLEHAGVGPEDIDFVINTHYHFDHCGGNTRCEGEEVVPNFPCASYLISRREYDDANQPNERSAATYFRHNWKPLEERGLLQIFDEELEVVPGVTVVHTPGHTAGHHSVKVESEGKVLFYMADLCPTSAHIGLPWIMGYDLYPLTTLETRKRIYPQAVDGKWLLFFEHDPEFPLGYLSRENGKYVLQREPWRERED